MRAPMIPGKRPEDADQREAMLRRLGIAEEKPRTPSRWDVLANRDLEPAPPVQTPPPPVLPEAAPPAETLRNDQPIPVAEVLRAYEPPAPVAEPEPEPEPVALQPEPVVAAPEPAPEPVIEAPVEPVRIERAAPAPEPIDSASFMSGWGEESIPEEEEEIEAFEAPEVEAAEPQATSGRWMEEPLPSAEAPPRREELLPRIERSVSYAPSSERVANDEDLDVPPPPRAVEPQAVEPALPPVAETPVEPMAARAPEPEPVAPPPVVEPPFNAEAPAFLRTAPQPAPEPPIVRQPVVEAPVERPLARQPEPAPQPVERPMAREPEPAPQRAGPPVDAALQQMRAELEAMRKQFQTAPAAPVASEALVAAAIPYERRGPAKPDFFANARMVVWTLAIVAALWVTFHALQASSHHAAKQDHILASVTGKEKADGAAADQNSDN